MKRKGNIRRAESAALAAVIASLMLPVNALGAQITDTGVEYFGSTGSQGKYTIMVFRPGKTENDLIPGENNSHVVAYENQGISNADGSFRVYFQIDGETGDYPVVWYSETTDTITKDSISFVNAQEFQLAVDGLNALKNDPALTADTVRQYLDANKRSLNLNISAELSAFAEIVYNDLREEAYQSDDFQGTTEKFLMENEIALLNTGACENIFEKGTWLIKNDNGFSKYFGTDGKYEKNLTMQKKVTKRAHNQKLTSLRQAVSALETAFVLSVIENPDGVENAREVMNTYSSLFSSATLSADNSVLNRALGTSYQSISAFETAVKNAGKSNDSGTSGGGGSRGSKSTSGGGFVVVQPEQQQDGTKETIPDDVYVDLEDAIWARNAIVSLTNLGILQGTGKDTFEPNANVTREQFVKMLVAAFVKNQEETELSFEDTDQNAWYYPFLRRAAANQMISGIDETHFGVGQNITRQDMAVMAYRAALSGYFTEETPADRFEDYSKVADYAKDAVNVMVKNGIINGVDSQHFAPDAFATRAQAAKIIYDIYRLLY